MASVHIEFALLQAIHAKLQVLSDLNDQLARCPRLVRAAESAERKLHEEWEAARRLLQETRKQADDKQLQLRQREARIEKLTGQKNAADNTRDFQLLGDQIVADQQANAVLEDEILELLEKADRIVHDVAVARSNHEKGVAEAARVRADVVGREERIKGELARVTAELAELERRIPGEIVGEYRRLVKAVGAGALAETDGETCGGCHCVITTQTLSDLYSRKAVHCKNCGSLLYPSARLLAAREN